MKEISTEERIRRLKLTCTLNDNGTERHFHNGYEYVEIGGVKWAKCNVGAEKETESGLYFQWGDTQGYTSEQVYNGEKLFTWDDYKFSDYNNLIKYNRTDAKTVLDFEYDAARTNMGGSFRMPTEEELLSLRNNTTYELTTINGVVGAKFTSKTDKTKYVFFPAVGYCYNDSVKCVGSFGYYWSSSLHSIGVSYAYYMFFGTSSVYWQNILYRCLGFSVRAVLG